MLRLTDKVGLVDTEFGIFLLIHRNLGIPAFINWRPTKKEWQRAISRAGYNITALACSVIRVGQVEYLFADGQVVWGDDEKGYGPRGLFMLSRNIVTRKVTNRTLLGDDGVPTTTKGIAAIKAQYPECEWRHE
jgi:hypothetical protein